MGEEPSFNKLLASVARDLVDEPDEQRTVQRVVDLAAQHLGGHVWASVTLVRRGGRMETPASTDVRADRADALQYELQEGPCLDAIWEQETFQIDDMATEHRYPRWTRRLMEETSIRSSLSFQLFTTGDSLGALNLYSPASSAFGEDDRTNGQVFAAQAAAALHSAQTEQHLRSALTTRNLIGQAQGILMERYGIGADRAFDFLRRLSQDNNLKLHEVARRVIENRPPRAPGRGRPGL